MRARIILAGLLAGVLGLAACDAISEDEDLVIFSDKETYAVEEPIRVTVANKTSHPHFINNCCGQPSFSVERRTDTGWEWMEEFACPALCDAAPYRVRRGQPVQQTLRLSEPGRYRFIVRYFDDDVTEFSDPISSKTIRVR